MKREKGLPSLLKTVDESDYKEVRLVERIVCPDRLFVTTEQLIDREKTAGDCKSNMFNYQPEHRSRREKHMGFFESRIN